ncbi:MULTISPECIES: TnsA endonuclease N-terminal domain-containing protein [Bacillus cereus group]|uniref:TnsA endonuclease N-terminal domain-containing protein n=1 Tax=Bacillus cereus group TaxID=86661 RepID=UPI0022E49BD5|nr:MULTISPECIES: TnsA endonuclease N-terminal domain-containing protein [unclassified Bacillus cereus group]MDA2665985.1 TnsA endonuclease N-terminal domain-containing protein [Bacillus cereus group sp. Bc032]MDA2676707.1 TnsA endonuclease N-terminal domain-containing protein [Bacillus cereus group sp. Bc031]MDA2682149.1 TnsA endonuclease N-terminal domain-containing protein [Bacillus cereus group sp. Bc029]MDA2687680.1 TnsA endonuclease N-terminal domain-containing protein [Bacillus cereus gro
MSKRKRTSEIEKWIKEGRGSGIGINYKPWLKIQDVSSLGRSTRLKGIKTSRQHEFLSDLERNYFYLTEHSDLIFDIREQFPLLPLEETIVIADELGIKHSTDPKTGEPIVMTTDFLLTVDKGQSVFEVARTVKMKDELLKERVLEKFEIEREYWQRRDIDWGIVTEEEIHKVMARNISYIHDYYNIRDYDVFQKMSSRLIEDLSLSLMQRLLNDSRSVRIITSEFDSDTHLPFGSGVTLFYHLLAQKIIVIDMFKPINLEEAIDIKAIDESKLKKVKYG